MLVSAISQHDGALYNFSTSMPYYGLKVDSEDNTTNTYRPVMRELVPQEDIPRVLDSVNQWKNFCHRQILGEKLDVIA